jgi:hypothetical protein
MVRRVVVAIVSAASALAAQGPQFEVASVKPADTPMGARVNGWDLRAGRLRLINQTLEQIIRTAYAPNMKLFPGLPLERMGGGPIGSGPRASPSSRRLRTDRSSRTASGR